MNGFLDIHHHIVYGVDDGPQTVEASMGMLRMALEDGISHIVATSHAMPAFRPFPLERYRRHLERLNLLCGEQGLDIVLYEGCEIFYSPTAVRQLDEGLLPTLAGSRYVLVEFDPTDTARRIADGARQMANAGYIPVIAHVERYQDLVKHSDWLAQMRAQLPIRIQMNASTVVGRPPRAVRKFRDRLLDGEWVDYVATDAHNTSSRQADMRGAFEELKRRYGAPRAALLTGKNQDEIFE